MADSEGKSLHWVYDCKTEYDIYYSDEVQSLYYQLYLNKFISYDKWIIQSNAKSIVKNKSCLSILDFGCGNGRYFPIIEELANDPRLKGKSIILSAADPSQVGLLNYRKILLAKGFELQTSRASEEQNGTTNILDVLCKNNLTIRLIYLNPQDSFEYLRKVLGDYDFIVCMFGVIAHIQTRSERQKVMGFLSSLLLQRGKIIFSVPSYRILKKQRKAFEVLREGKFQIQIGKLPIKLEEGDLLYTRDHNGKHVENFLHVYRSSKEIVEDVKTTDLEMDGSVRINKILHETKLVRNKLLSKIDEYISRLLTSILPCCILDKIAAYYLIVCSKNKL